MTSYRAQQKLSFYKRFGVGEYLLFLGWLFGLLVLHVANIPAFFGGQYHLFVFEAGLFYLLFSQQFKLYCITILFFYFWLDAIDSSVIGASFFAFMAAFFITLGLKKALFKEGWPPVLSPFIYAAGFGIFLMVFEATKLIIFYGIQGGGPSLENITYFLKSLLYNFIVCLNLALIFK